MAKIFYFMREPLVKLFGEKKDELILARSQMTAEEAEKGKAEILQAARINDIDKNGEAHYQVVDNIAIIPIKGMLADHVNVCMAWFDMNVTTYRFIRESVKSANNNPDVDAILLDNDSGGGFVYECETTFQTILNSEKPVFSIVRDMAASADYWLPSASKEIITVSKTAFLGSIGVATEIINYKDQEKKEGINRITLTNTSSKKKRPDELTKEGQQVYIDELDALYDVFAKSLLIKRGKKLTREKIDALDGTVLISSDAIDYGLADKYMLEENVLPYIKDKIEKKPVSFIGLNTTPVQGKTEDTKMTLSEFLATNPEAKAEHNNLLAAKHAEGVEAGKSEIQKTIKAIAPVMASEAYDATLKSQAAKAMQGEISLEAFQAVLSMEDMRIEREKSNKAKDDSDKNAGLKPDSGADKSIIANQEAQKKLKEAARYA